RRPPYPPPPTHSSSTTLFRSERAHDLPVDFIWRRHHRQLFEGHDHAFAADVDAHAFGPAAHVEQSHQLGLVLEKVEELSQAAHVDRKSTRLNSSNGSISSAVF